MTKEFDEKNMAKSRRVCAAMAEAASTSKRVLTERERQILAMWPRFDDAEYVWFGDAYIDGRGDANEVRDVRFDDKYVCLVGVEGFHTAFIIGERVKRPAPKVLDADGVEIKVGDTVWHEDGSEWLVEEVDRYGARCFDGDKRRTFNPKYLTHTRPAPKVLDADGVEIKVGDTVWFKGNPRPYAVVEVKDGSVRLHSKTHCSEESATTVWTDILTHTRPDSWERLEEDAEFNDETGIVGGNLDIVRRAKALAGVEVAE